MSRSLWTATALVLAVAVLSLPSGCSGGSSGSSAPPPPAEPITDLTGFWEFTEICDRTDCGDGFFMDTFVIEITQTGNDLVIRTPFGIFGGIISGAQVTWSGNRFEFDGTRASNVSAVVNEAGSIFMGIDQWTWLSNDNPAFICAGECDITATRITGNFTSIDVSGLWTMQEDCNEVGCGGGLTTELFSVIFTQFGPFVEIDTPVGSFQGQVLGNDITWSGSYPRDDGTFTFTAQILVSADEQSFDGTLDWELDAGGSVCVGTCVITGIRETAPPGGGVDVSGVWFETRTCDNVECGGGPMDVQTDFLEVDQLGNTFLMDALLNGGDFFGRLSGDVAYWSGTRTSGGVTETFTAFAVVDASGLLYDGILDFYRSNGTETCRGSCTVAGDRICPEIDLGSSFPVSVSGSTAAGFNDFFPICDPQSMANDLTYRWVAPGTGTFVFDTLGSNFNTVLSIIDGNCMGVEIGCNDDAPGTITSEVTLNLQEGQLVTIVIDGVGTDSGDFVLNIN